MLITLLAVEWLLMVLLLFSCLEEQGTIMVVFEPLYLTSVCIHGVRVAIYFSRTFYETPFCCRPIHADPQSPTAIFFCDNPTTWLQRVVTDTQLRRRLREIIAEKDELVSQVHHLTEEKKASDREKEGEKIKRVVFHVGLMLTCAYRVD